jgi:hypothetical protein
VNPEESEFGAGKGIILFFLSSEISNARGVGDKGLIGAILSGSKEGNTFSLTGFKSVPAIIVLSC